VSSPLCLFGVIERRCYLLICTAQVRATGKRFRETVLAMGGGRAPGEVYALFRGKAEASPDALLRHSGLKGANTFVRNYKDHKEDHD
jgi:hypothetical protein